MAYFTEVPVFVSLWESDPDMIIPHDIARTIAEYWASNTSNGEMVKLARGVYRLHGVKFHDDIAEAVVVAKHMALDTIIELFALKAWALHHEISETSE